MTGAEIIIIKDSEAVLCKVRFDGEELYDAIVAEYLRGAEGTPKELWKKIRTERRKNFDQDYLDEEIETKFAEGFDFTIRGAESRDFWTLSDLAESEMARQCPDGDDGYFCGYTDHVALIDLDVPKGERVWVKDEV